MSNKKEFFRFKKLMDSYPEDIYQKISQVLEANAQEAATYAKTRAPKHDGDLQKGIRVIAESERNTKERVSRSVVSEAPYSPYVEFGTKKRASPPPEWSDVAQKFIGPSGNTGAYERIMKWATSNGLTKDEGEAVFFSIMRHGIHPQPFMYPAFIKQKPQLIKDLKKLF